MATQHEAGIPPQKIYATVSSLLGTAINELPSAEDKQARNDHLLLIKRSYEALSNDEQDQFDIRLCDRILKELDKGIKGAKPYLTDKGGNAAEASNSIKESLRLLSFFLNCSSPKIGFLGDTPKDMWAQLEHDFIGSYSLIGHNCEHASLSDESSINKPAVNRSADFCSAALSAQRPLLLLGDTHRVGFKPQPVLDLVISITKEFSETVEINLEISGDALIHTDQNCLTLVAYNLLKNAVRANRRMPELKIDITVDSITDEQWAVIKFRDNGKGIDIAQLRRSLTEQRSISTDDMSDEDVLALLFQPNISMSAGGTGLGLHLVRTIIHDRLGGQVSISNHQEGGAEVLIRLPNESNQPLL